MTTSNTVLDGKEDDNERIWKCSYIFGGIAALIALAGILLDAVLGASLGGNLVELPQTAVARFVQLQQNQMLGLYNLDLLNVIIQLILIPVYFALFAAQRKMQGSHAALALVIFLVGTTIMVTNNAALGMLELSKRYSAATAESQKIMLAAAGEALLAKGAHGSAGALPGFLLPSIAGVLMSYAMLNGRIFSRATAWLGMAGSALMVSYLALVTFVPEIKTMATIFAIPGGLLLMAWIILFTIRLWQLGLNNK